MKSDSEPIYLQIRRVLEKELMDIHRPGDQLDSEGALAERFNVNRHTLRRAVDELVDRGLLERRRGLGLFVLEPTFDYPLHSETRLTANLANMGVGGERTFTRRYHCPAPASVAAKLGLTEGELCVCLESIIHVAERSLSLATHYFPETRVPGLFSDFGVGSLHSFMHERYGMKLRRVSSTVSAQMPGVADATALRIPRNIPLLHVRSVNFDTRDESPVEYVESRFRSDRIELSIRFTANELHNQER